MDRDIDNEKAVRLCLDGAQPGQVPPPRRSVSEIVFFPRLYQDVEIIVFFIFNVGWTERWWTSGVQVQSRAEGCGRVQGSQQWWPGQPGQRGEGD
jgi:hypothetical protein